MEKDDIKLILSSLRQKTKSLFVNIGIWLWRWSRWGGGLPIASLIIIGLGLFVFLRFEVTGLPANYLLSAISQSLAAILAITLSATLVAGQLASRYSPKPLREAFKPATIFYVVLFIAGIILPLVILANKDIASSVVSVKVSLILAGTCLAFLIPYFLSLREWISPKDILNGLYRKASKQLRYEKTRLPEEVFTIRQITLSLYNAKNYEAYSYGLQKLPQLIKAVTLPHGKAEGEKEEGQEESTEQILPLQVVRDLIDMLRDIRISVGDDAEAITKVVEALGDCALTVKDPEINREIIEGLKEGVGAIIEHSKEGRCKQIAFAFGGIGGKAAARGQRIGAKGLLQVLGNMCFLALDKQRDNVTRQVIISIYSVGGIAVDNEPQNASKRASVSREAVMRLYQSYNTAVVKKRLNPAAEAAWRLRALGWKAIEKGLKPPTEEAISGMGKIAQKTIELRRELPTKEAIEALVGYGNKVVEKFPDEVVTSCLKWLTTIGSMVFDDYEELAWRVIEGLGEIGKQAAMQAEPKLEVVKEVISSLSSLTEKINGAKVNLASLIATQLWGIGGYAVEQASIKDALNNLKKRAGEEALESGFRYVELHWDPRPPWLSGFKEYYDTDC